MNGHDSWSVPPAAAGERLDRHLASRYDASRAEVQRWIRDGRVRLDGEIVKPARLLAGGERLDCEPPPPATDDRVTAEAGELRVLHADLQIVVLDKPAGLAVHPGAGRSAGTLAHRLLAHFPEIEGVGGPGRPGIVHRLDKDTTGVLVVARTTGAYRALSRDFAARRVAKRYLAIVYGHPDPALGSITEPIARHPRQRKQMRVDPRGRPAATGYRTLSRVAEVAALELDLATGRTHQIRVHLKHLGHPLVGDPVYGEARWRAVRGSRRNALAAFPRPALHAWQLCFPHPASGQCVRFEAPVPGDLIELWSAVGGGNLEAALPEDRAGSPC